MEKTVSATDDLLSPICSIIFFSKHHTYVHGYTIIRQGPRYFLPPALMMQMLEMPNYLFRLWRSHSPPGRGGSGARPRAKFRLGALANAEGPLDADPAVNTNGCASSTYPYSDPVLPTTNISPCKHHYYVPGDPVRC